MAKRQPGVAYGRVEQRVSGGSVMADQAAPAAAAGSMPAVDVSQEQACQILEDGEVNGAPLTPAQQRLFGAICSGKSMKDPTADTARARLDIAHETPLV